MIKQNVPRDIANSQRASQLKGPGPVAEELQGWENQEILCHCLESPEDGIRKPSC